MKNNKKTKMKYKIIRLTKYRMNNPKIYKMKLIIKMTRV